MELYRWQKECLEAWELNQYRGIVNVITGGGKTVLALAAAQKLLEKYPDLYIRIVVPTIPLAEQWKQALIRSAEEEADLPGFFGGMRKDPADRRYMIYIINSARFGLSRHIRADLAVHRHVLLIVDECHRVTSKENRKIFNFLTPEKEQSSFYCCLGLSATPFSGEEEEAFLQRVLGKEICRYGLANAVRDGVVAPFSICQVGVGFSQEELKRYNDLSEQIRGVLGCLLDQHPWLRELPEQSFIRRVTALATLAGDDPKDPAVQFLRLCYQRKSLCIFAKERIPCCIQLLEKLTGRNRVLIFCERIEQAEAIAGVIRHQFGAGICGIYHSKMSAEARKRNLALFRSEAVQILVTCRCLDEGIDVPDADAGIVVSSSSLKRQRIQRLGRIIRQFPGKSAACLYYIYVRESTDNRAYLPCFEEYRTFDLQYDKNDRCFSNDLYEYAAKELLVKAEKNRLKKTELTELRRCLLEGLTRADYLLDRAVQHRNAEKAGNIKEKNYWIAMQGIGKYFVDTEGENDT